MTSPISQPIPSGCRAIYRCWMLAGIVFAYLVCSALSQDWGDDSMGRIAREVFGLPFGSTFIRYATGLCLLAGLIWAYRGAKQSCKDPRVRKWRFFSYIPLSFLSLVTWIVLFATAPFSQWVPWDVWWALAHPEHVTLYSIGQGRHDEFDAATGKFLPPREDGIARFHGREILVSVTLDGKQATEAAGAFRYSLSFPSFLPASCFNPRHGLQITSGGHVYDILLCYECQGIVVFRDEKEVTYRSASGSSTVLNALLTNAKVPLQKFPD